MACFKSIMNKGVSDYVKENISRYAEVSPIECFAECFNEYICSPKPRKMASWYGERIDKFFGKTARTVESAGKSGIIKVDKVVSGHASTPKKSASGSVIDRITDDGSVNVRSFYGDDGMKMKGIHTNDHGFPKHHKFGMHGEHAHDYECDENGNLKNKTTREISNEEMERSGDIL